MGRPTFALKSTLPLKSRSEEPGHHGEPIAPPIASDRTLVEMADRGQEYETVNQFLTRTRLCLALIAGGSTTPLTADPLTGLPLSGHRFRLHLGNDPTRLPESI